MIHHEGRVWNINAMLSCYSQVEIEMGKSPQSFERWRQEGAARKVENLVSESGLRGLNTEAESEVTKGDEHGIRWETRNVI